MKRLFIACLVVMISAAASAQTYITQVKPVDSKTWGYADASGQMVIPAIFRKCYAFSENGLAVIMDDKTLQFVDLEGKMTLPAEQGLVVKQGKGFYDDLVAVMNKSKKMGYLNPSGGIAIDLKYDKITVFDEGHALAMRDGQAFVLDKDGEEQPVKVSGLLNLKPFSEGLSPFKLENKKWGYINTEGEQAIEPQFDGAGDFVNGMAWARSGEKIGYISPDGSWLIEPQFTQGKNFDPVSGMARIKQGDNWGYTDASGKVYRMPDTDKWDDFSEGVAIGRKDGKFGFYGKDMKWAISPIFESVRSFKNGYAAVKLNGKWGFIDASGEVVVLCTYAGVKDMELVKSEGE